MKATRLKTTLWLLLSLALATVSCAPPEREMEVTVIVDFGPANRPEVQQKVSVPEKSTVFDALRAAFPVVTSGR